MNTTDMPPHNADGRCPRCHPSDDFLTWYRDQHFYAQTTLGDTMFIHKTAEERAASHPRPSWRWIDSIHIHIDDLRAHHHNHGTCCEHSYSEGCKWGKC